MSCPMPRDLTVRRWLTAVDVLADHLDTRSLLVIEVKASLGSLEAPTGDSMSRNDLRLDSVWLGSDGARRRSPGC